MERETQLTKKRMLAALKHLDEILPQPVQLIIGGGGAMVLAHKHPLSTTDIDAIPKGMDDIELAPFIKQVARDLNLAPDWLNPWFSSFSHTLPHDFESRLISVFNGKKIKAHALGAEDLLVMKCFAGRQKDVSHARALIKNGADLKIVRNHIESLNEKGVPRSEAALEFLDDIEDQV